MKQVVVCESVARKLYGRASEAVGKHVDVNFVEYSIVGVVKDVSKFAEMSYAEIWVPYTANASLTYVNTSGWGNGHSGNFICFILARSPGDFDKIREELKVSIAKMNDSSPDFYLDIMEQPSGFFYQMLNKFAYGGTPPMIEAIRYIIIISLILLIPSVNLSGLTHSRMRKRLSEIGIRKAFGANRRELMAKYNEYTAHRRAVYAVLNLNNLAGQSYQNVPWYGCYIRVRPDADVDGFMKNFRKEMRTQLMIGNLYLEDMHPMSAARDMQLKDYRSEVYMYITVIVFFLLNAFLAVLGTFWSRTQQRRSELALRIALGSSKMKINRLLNYEGIGLLTLAFILAMILTWNLGIAELVSVNPVEFTAERFIISSLITYGLLALIVRIAIWYPAYQAMKIQPAEALHEE